MNTHAMAPAVAAAAGAAAAALWLGAAPAGSRAEGATAPAATDHSERSDRPGSARPRHGASGGPSAGIDIARARGDLAARGDRAARAELATAIEDILADRPSEIEDARVGISVADVSRGEFLYERSAGEGFSVASNAKVVTTAAALAHLGPDFRFRTAAYADDLEAGGRVPGDLYLRSSGDPWLDTYDLRRLVDELALAGVEAVEGDIVIDDRTFDDDTTPPHFDDYEEPSDHHASYRPPVAAASLNFNTITVATAPHPDGSGPARVATDPPTTYAELSASVATTQRGRSRIQVRPRVRDDRLHLTVSGQINEDSHVRRERVRVHDPARYLGGTLATLLAERGIAIEGAAVRRGAVPREAETLATRHSKPLARIVQSLGKYSNNFVAESLLKTLGAEFLARGRPATWDDGLEVARGYLEDVVGLEPDSYRYENGSGLFDATEFTPRQMASILATARRDTRYGPELVSSLAVAGTDGTMRTRLAGEPGERRVRAKTGTLMQVSALSGYAAIDDRTPLAFAILMDDVPRRGRGDARDLQDEIAAAFVDYLNARRDSAGTPITD